MTGSVLAALPALLAVLGLVLLAAVALRGGLAGDLLARLGGRGGGRLRVVERRAVDPRSVLLLVAVDGVEYAVLSTPGGPLLLARRPVRETEA